MFQVQLQSLKNCSQTSRRSHTPLPTRIPLSYYNKIHEWLLQISNLASIWMSVCVCVCVCVPQAVPQGIRASRLWVTGRVCVCVRVHQNTSASTSPSSPQADTHTHTHTLTQTHIRLHCTSLNLLGAMCYPPPSTSPQAETSVSLLPSLSMPPTSLSVFPNVLSFPAFFFHSYSVSSVFIPE